MSISNEELSAVVETSPKPRTKIARRSQAERSSEMQLRVCEATIETLCEIGFDRLSLATVAERAGISRGAITHHFKTKTDILVGAFEYSIGRFKAERARFVAEYKNPTAEDFIRFVWRQNFSQPNYIASIDLMLAARADAELQRRIKDLFRGWLGVRDVLNQEIFGEEIGGIPRERYVELIYSAMRDAKPMPSPAETSNTSEEVSSQWRVAKKVLVEPYRKESANDFFVANAKKGCEMVMSRSLRSDWRAA